VGQGSFLGSESVLFDTFLWLRTGLLGHRRCRVLNEIRDVFCLGNGRESGGESRWRWREFDGMRPVSEVVHWRRQDLDSSGNQRVTRDHRSLAGAVELKIVGCSQSQAKDQELDPPRCQRKTSLWIGCHRHHWMARFAFLFCAPRSFNRRSQNALY
jgi:hypothetical protein